MSLSLIPGFKSLWLSYWCLAVYTCLCLACFQKVTCILPMYQYACVLQVKVMLRICPSDGHQTGSFLSLDARKKQVTVYDPSHSGFATSAHRRAGAAPKMFAFDAIFSQDDSMVSTRLSIKSYSAINSFSQDGTNSQICIQVLREARLFVNLSLWYCGR